MGINLLFKNMEGLYGVLQCPKCKKLIFLKQSLEQLSYEVEGKKYLKQSYLCCECLIKLKPLWDIETAKIEIEL